MKKNREVKVVFILLALLFLIFLAVPVVQLLLKSILGGSGISLEYYKAVFTGRGFGKAVGNSFLIAGVSAFVTTLLAFFMAYTIHYTNIAQFYKKIIRGVAVLPMLLPTITYGFAIIYSFGKQGLFTKLFGTQLFEIYGFNGLLLGYVIYTLPISFMLIDNTMKFIDKKYMIVSRIMGDNGLSTFWITVVRPLLGTLAASFIQSFFLCFTDFGIPASVGGEFDVIASVLYNQMLGSIPDFNKGAVVAVVMLIPSIVSILVLHYLEKYNVRYNKISAIEIKRNRKRDAACGIFSGIFMLCIVSVFLVIFIIPFVEEWPYNIQFTLKNIQNVLSDPNLSNVYTNSLFVAVITAVCGTLTAYGAALVTARSTMNSKLKSVIESIALITNTIPGMVLGLAFLFAFSGSSLQNTFFIIVICNIVHFFSTPYLMMKNSLAKMNASWETTAKLMGDSWIKTVIRIVTPNAVSTILEVFSYYFINAMVTISAVIFIAGARTMVITTKIKELQHYAKFNEIFVLSLLILFTNIVGKILFKWLANRKQRNSKGE
ncbi:ABC transporter permease subunit [uncultured Robinsoniella sp.]|uniref:ABC transporter permease subunit n=1 Tax=uncultured Robinsoniella sp. TaxID=904190 RepID=UPI00374F75FA